MAFELWKEPRVIAASVLSLVIARAVYKKNQVTGRPPVVSYTIPWVGSAIDLGRDPDAFFKRATYVKQLFTRWKLEIISQFLALNTGISSQSRLSDGPLPMLLRHRWMKPVLSYHGPFLADSYYQLIAEVYKNAQVWSIRLYWPIQRINPLGFYSRNIISLKYARIWVQKPSG